MTDAREIMAQAQADYWENPGIPQGYMPMVDHVLVRLTAAGFRILGPEEIDGPTVEKCAVEMEVNWGHVCTPELRDAIRALKEKRT